MKIPRKILVVSILVVMLALFAVSLAFAQGGGSSAAAEFGSQATVPASGGTVCGGSGGSVGIIHDDGVFENGYSGNPASITVFQNVDLFNPVGPAYAYTRYCVGLVSLAGTTLNFEIVFYDNDGAGGAPGTELAAVPASASNIPNGLPCGWYEYDLTSVAGLPTGADGNIYIGTRYSPASYPSVFTCADQTATTPLWTGYTQFNAQGWATTQTSFVNYRAMSHRVEMTEGLDPAITLVKTVGTDPASCATTTSISADYGSTVYYCYTVENTGNVTLTHHTVTDSVLGTVVGPGFVYTLAPSASLSITESYVLMTNTVTNDALWTAYISGTNTVATATASATVTGLPTDVSLSSIAGQTSGSFILVALMAGLVLLAGAVMVVRRQQS